MYERPYVEEDDPDPYMVDRLAQAAITAMGKASITGITTPSELLSAAFAVLERNLVTIRENQDPRYLVENTREVAAILKELLLDYGTLPN